MNRLRTILALRRQQRAAQRALAAAPTVESAHELAALIARGAIVGGAP